MREACCQFLEKQLDSTNCLGIKIFAERHNCSNLWAAADRYSVRHFQDVVTQEEFKSLPLDEVEALVKSDHLQVGYVALFLHVSQLFSCALSKS